MEGLIPFLVRAVKKQNLHNKSYRCLSDGSRRSYHMLASAGDSVNGSTHRRTQSEFQVPSSLELQPQADFVRSHSVKSASNMDNNNSNSNNENSRLRHIQHHHNSPAAASAYNYSYDYGDKRIGSNSINKFHQY